MKKSYKIILIFQIIIFLILLLNSFVSNILGEYNIILLLVIVLIVFKQILGYEKGKHIYVKDVMYDIAIYLFTFFLLYYILGFLIGFAKTGNYYTFNGIKTFILPSILFIVLKEILRYMMLTKSQGCKLLIVTTFILIVFLDLTNSLYYNSFGFDYNTFKFIALTIIPTISTNLFCTYLSMKVGFVPAILYLLVINLYPYLIPIIPNPNEYLVSIINLILPIIILYKIYSFFDKEKDKYIGSEYRKNDNLSLGICAVIILVMVYFTSGHFKYYTIAIASGSMSPNIRKGDAVVVEKINKNYEDLKVGQIIAYSYNGTMIVHRLENIIESKGKSYYYTKGDANKDIDNYAITEDMIVGVVKFKIPYLGIPTVGIRELVS